MSNMAPAFPAALTTPQPRRVSLPASAPPTPRPAHSTPVPHDLTTPRARARIARLRASEAAERYEDQAALLMTPAQFAALRRSFAGVKTEFADLDGMSWALAPGGTVRGGGGARRAAGDERTVRAATSGGVRRRRPVMSLGGAGRRPARQVA